MITFGTLTYKEKPIYTFNEADEDLMIRSLYGEAGKNAAKTPEGLCIISTMIQRWAMFLTLPWYQQLLLKDPQAKVYGYDEFNEMLAAYSQPVNPNWLNGGKFDKDPSTIDEYEFRRAELLSKPLEQFPKDIIDLVRNCFNGKSSLKFGMKNDMAGLVHFFCPSVYYARKLKKKFRDLTDSEVEFANKTAYASNDPKNLIYSQPSGISLRSNAFYKTKRTKNWKPDFVTVQ